MYGTGAFFLLALGFIATAQAQPTTLTLACQGKTNSVTNPDEPISMGIIVNFTNRTVQGFGFPGLIDIPVKITAANEVTVAFEGHQQVFPTSIESIQGSIDRVTGDMEATSRSSDPKTSEILFQMTYTLKCRPTQRMF